MLSLTEIDRICAATQAGAFGVQMLDLPQVTETILRKPRAAAPTTRQAAVRQFARRGTEQGKL